jgi:hypothetical protein
MGPARPRRGRPPMTAEALGLGGVAVLMLGALYLARTEE